MDTHNNVLILGGGVEWVEAEECIGVINANEKHTKNELLGWGGGMGRKGIQL